MDINATAYFRNSVEVLRFMYQSQVEGLRKATDRGVWEMNPATVNAYYQPIKNEIGTFSNMYDRTVKGVVLVCNVTPLVNKYPLDFVSLLHIYVIKETKNLENL